MALAFVIGSRLSDGRLIEGCVVQGIGLACTAVLASTTAHPAMTLLMLPSRCSVRLGHGAGAVVQRGADPGAACPCGIGRGHAGDDTAGRKRHRSWSPASCISRYPGDRWALVATVTALGCTVLGTLGCLCRMRGRAALAASRFGPLAMSELHVVRQAKQRRIGNAIRIALL